MCKDIRSLISIAVVFVILCFLVYQFSYVDTRAVDGPILWGFPLPFYTQDSGMAVAVTLNPGPAPSLVHWNIFFLIADLISCFVAALLAVALVQVVQKRFFTEKSL